MIVIAGSANRRSIIAPSSAELRADVVRFRYSCRSASSAARAANGVVRLLGHGAQKVVDPLLPLAVLADVEKQAVVVVAMPFEKSAEIEQRMIEQLLRVKEKRDQQPSDAAVAVEKRMNGLEVVVDQRERINAGRCDGACRNFSNASSASCIVGNRRRDVLRVGDSRAGRADPVLQMPELARVAAAAANAAHQPFVHFANEAKAERQLLQPLQSVVERGDVVRHFVDIAASDRSVACFESDQVADRRLRSFDAARQHRFAPREGRDQQVRIRQGGADAAQIGDSPFRAR